MKGIHTVQTAKTEKNGARNWLRPAFRAIRKACHGLFARQRAAFLFSLLMFTSFAPPDPAPPSPPANCNPHAEPFHGYTFLLPDIINKNTAYAPFFVRWDDYYQKYYFSKDIQKQENIKEWAERFCGQPDTADVEYVVYKASSGELNSLRSAALEKSRSPRLPYLLEENTFALMLAYNGCTEVIDYLLYAKRCEPHAVLNSDEWTLPAIDPGTMQNLIDEGLGRFQQTASHFLKMRYAYQIVRLAHYGKQWQYTVDLYNYLLPKIDRRKPSTLFFWTLGHLAGALRQLGKIPEASYRYALVFRHCAAKRTQAYRSFLIRNDADWKATLRLCESDDEIATLYLLRAAGSPGFVLEDLEKVYELEPTNKQLDLLLVSSVQDLEKTFLRTPVTDKKYGVAQGAMKRDLGAKNLLDLQKFVRQVIKENECANPKLWRALNGYLNVLAGDRYAASQEFDRVEKMLDDSDYDQEIFKQLETWRLLVEIQNLNVKNAYVDAAALRIRGYDTYQQNPNFEPFLQDWLSAAYAANNNPGKALLSAFSPEALTYNPRLDVLEDLLKAAATEDPAFLERAMQIDTNPDLIKGRLLEIKGAHLLSIGQPEAALLALRAIPPEAQLRMTKYSPFKEVFDERTHRTVIDSMLLNRRQIVEKLIDYEFRGKAAEAVGDPAAAWYYYLIGLAYYNMSYFGYEWEAMDFYRSGYNWLRLPSGPVYPLTGSPDGNRENIDLSLALSYFEKALDHSRNTEMSARAAFMAARCQQKQWFCQPDTRYRPGNKLIPTLPGEYYQYYDLLIRKYQETAFFQERVKECKWLAAYSRE